MTTSRKAPQDRKPKAVEPEPIVRPEDTPGFDLLKSIDDVPVWDQAPLLSLVSQLMGDAKEGEEVHLEEGQALYLMGEIAKAMLPWALDQAAFTKFCSGKNAMQRVMDLAMAWTAALGEGESSDAS
jgi:hypothetical protein